jgi:hypothetical protein
MEEFCKHSNHRLRTKNWEFLDKQWSYQLFKNDFALQLLFYVSLKLIGYFPNKSQIIKIKQIVICQIFICM